VKVNIFQQNVDNEHYSKNNKVAVTEIVTTVNIFNSIFWKSWMVLILFITIILKV